METVMPENTKVEDSIIDINGDNFIAPEESDLVGIVVGSRAYSGANLSSTANSILSIIWQTYKPIKPEILKPKALDICPIWIKLNGFLNVWYKNASLLLISSQIRHLPRLRCLLLLTQVGEVGVAGALVRSLVVADRNGDIVTVTKTLKGMTVAPDSTDRSRLAWPMIVVSLTKISKRLDASHIYSTERENFRSLNFTWLLLQTLKSIHFHINDILNRYLFVEGFYPLAKDANS